MFSFWNSVDAVSLASSIARWLGAFIAIAVLILGHRLSTLQARAKLPRQITAEQRQRFIEHLRNVPKGPVAVRTNSVDDDETANFMDAVRSLLNDAGFSGDARIQMATRMVSDGNDMAIVITSKESAPPYTGELQGAFEAIGLDVPGIIPKQDLGWLKPGEVVVFIRQRQ